MSEFHRGRLDEDTGYRACRAGARRLAGCALLVMRPVVLRPRRPVGQQVKRLLDLIEALRGVGSMAHVRVVLQDQLMPCPRDLLAGGVAGHAEHGVRIRTQRHALIIPLREQTAASCLEVPPDAVHSADGDQGLRARRLSAVQLTLT